MALNNKGQLFSLDLLLYLVALSVVLMLSLYIYTYFDSSSADLMHDALSDQRLDTLEEALFKTPGSPANWDETNRVDTIGLCVSNGSYMISYDKLVRLKANPDLIYTVFPREFKCNIILESTSNPIDRINIINTYSYSLNDNVIVRRVPIIIDYGYNISPINSNEDEYNCPYNHLNDSVDWRCKSFDISSDTIVDTNYYLVTSDADVILSNTYGENQTFHINDKMDITDKLKQLIHDDEDTIYIHIHSNSVDNYLVGDKNNRAQHINSVSVPEKYTAIIEVST